MAVLLQWKDSALGHFCSPKNGFILNPFFFTRWTGFWGVKLCLNFSANQAFVAFLSETLTHGCMLWSECEHVTVSHVLGCNRHWNCGCFCRMQGECTSVSANFGTSRRLAGTGGMSAMTRYRTFFEKPCFYTNSRLEHDGGDQQGLYSRCGFCNHFSNHATNHDIWNIFSKPNLVKPNFVEPWAIFQTRVIERHVFKPRFFNQFLKPLFATCYQNSKPQLFRPLLAFKHDVSSVILLVAAHQSRLSYSLSGSFVHIYACWSVSMECIFHRTCFKIRSLPGSNWVFHVGQCVCYAYVFLNFLDRSLLAKCFWKVGAAHFHWVACFFGRPSRDR